MGGWAPTQAQLASAVLGGCCSFTYISSSSSSSSSGSGGDESGETAGVRNKRLLAAAVGEFNRAVTTPCYCNFSICTSSDTPISTHYFPLYHPSTTSLTLSLPLPPLPFYPSAPFYHRNESILATHFCERSTRQRHPLPTTVSRSIQRHLSVLKMSVSGLDRCSCKRTTLAKSIETYICYCCRSYCESVIVCRAGESSASCSSVTQRSHTGQFLCTPGLFHLYVIDLNTINCTMESITK